ncbi:VPEID-CTERM sorting domain-containing protein [Paracoccus albicereus]|nr:VPEID-CTERM sorting domain-containing protein [Paracoccus albicereus]
MAVPEISALEGTAAIAALAAIVLLTWERRRRAH